MFGYFYSMSLYDDYCNLISALWVSNGNICQSIKENALPEGCSHRLLRLTCLRKQEKKKENMNLHFYLQPSIITKMKVKCKVPNHLTDEIFNPAKKGEQNWQH